MSLMHAYFKKLTNPFQRLQILRAEEHRKFLRIWLSYIVILALLYMVLPVVYERDWLEFFEPVQNGYLPYIDFHVGYPPIGFLTFLPLVFLSNFNLTIFSALMRTINAFFLIMAVLLIYLIVYKVRNKRDAIISALIVMVSFSTISYNRHSNDSIALFFALLAVYFMLDRKICSAGLAIGLGAMVKIIPGLLVIPAFKRFKGTRERVLLLGSAYMVILLLNLPFVIINPFMWLGTYLYNGARGPWETIWALIEGWYGPGGAKALHPYFEAFIPYTQLMTFYHPSPHDQAYYAWHYPWLPTLLFVLGIASLLLSYFIINKHDVTKEVALTLFLFMFFSKGYSPQFTIFMLPFMAMALEGTKKIYLCAMLETGTILQWVVWGVPGFYSPMALPSAVILRTITFALVIGILMTHFLKRKKTIKLPSINLPVVKSLKGKFLVIFMISILTVGASIYYLINHYSQFPLSIETRKGTIDMKLYETTYLPLLNLTKNDRVMFNLTSTVPSDVSVTKDNEKIWSTKNPQYNVRDLFVYKDPENYFLVIYMAYPESNFTIIDETNGNGKGKIEQIDDTGEALNITLIDFGNEHSHSSLRLSWSVENLVVADDFKVDMMVRHFSGHINRTMLSLSSFSTGDVYEYEIPLNDDWSKFEVNSSSATLDGLPFSQIRGKQIEAINIVFIVDNANSASIGLRDLKVLNEEEVKKRDLSVKETS
ncbi:MAG: ArnT family glycosyltransferase, partial [Candidatus Bathyarchaeia archaeon]